MLNTILDGTQKVHLTPDALTSDNKYTPSMDTFYFSVCGPESEKGIIPNPNGFATCRESLQTMVENEVLGLKDKRGFPVDKGRFLLKLRREREECLAKAIYVIHSLEEKYGFTKTLCYRVGIDTTDHAQVNDPKREIYKTKIGFYYIVASRKWIKSSYMVSLLFLIMRTIYQCADRIPPKALESFDAFVKSANDSSFVQSLSYVRDTYSYWDIMLRNYHELFGKFKIEHNWSSKFMEMRDEATMRYEGVYRLCTTSYSTKMKKRWTTIKQKDKERSKAT